MVVAGGGAADVVGVAADLERMIASTASGTAWSPEHADRRCRRSWRSRRSGGDRRRSSPRRSPRRRLPAATEVPELPSATSLDLARPCRDAGRHRWLTESGAACGVAGRRRSPRARVSRCVWLVGPAVLCSAPVSLSPARDRGRRRRLLRLLRQELLPPAPAVGAVDRERDDDQCQENDSGFPTRRRRRLERTGSCESGEPPVTLRRRCVVNRQHMRRAAPSMAVP